MHASRLAITMGDPTGIGPEVIAAAWGQAALHACCAPVVLGHPDVLRRAVALQTPRVEVVAVAAPDEITPDRCVMPVLNVCAATAAMATPGLIDPRGGQAAYDALMAAIDLTFAGQFDGIVTCPLHKAALWQAGHHYPGHTELLAERCGVQQYAMMLYLAAENECTEAEAAHHPAGLGVVHVTLHMALRDVFDSLTTAAVEEKIHLAHAALGAIKESPPRIGVCALNPHAGEEGLFGDEEARIILPAVQAAAREGILVTGPLPADTLLVRARDGEFDGVVAMYHDQGHIALKLLGMHRAVNVTLGLPIVRTSVAHGTAHDIAWQGRADCRSLIAAAQVAAQLASQKLGREFALRSEPGTK